MIVSGRKDDKLVLLEIKAERGSGLGEQRKMGPGSSCIQGRWKRCSGALGTQGEWAPSEVTPDRMQMEDMALDGQGDLSLSSSSGAGKVRHPWVKASWQRGVCATCKEGSRKGKDNQ